MNIKKWFDYEIFYRDYISGDMFFFDTHPFSNVDHAFGRTNHSRDLRFRHPFKEQWTFINLFADVMREIKYL